MPNLINISRMFSETKYKVELTDEHSRTRVPLFFLQNFTKYGSIDRHKCAF